MQESEKNRGNGKGGKEKMGWKGFVSSGISWEILGDWGGCFEIGIWECYMG